MPKTLFDWLTHLESLHPKSIALGLERVAQVKQRLALHPDFPLIVVGGTNGKGSVCAMLEAILFAAGYKVGCYTSPHLLQYNERVRINKQQESDAELCASFAAIELARKPTHSLPISGGGLGWGLNPGATPPSPPSTRKEYSARHSTSGRSLRSPSQGEGTSSVEQSLEIPLTYFEFGTLAAMQCFIAHKVDVAILEVGLGGRLDAVNVFDADCAIVASVDIDHTDYLGETREQIAFEKAGIFRKDRVAICADNNVPQAIRDHAQQIGAELWSIGSEFGFQLPSPVYGRGVGGEGDKNSGGDIESPLSPSPLPQGGEGFLSGQWDFFSLAGKRSSLPFPALRGAFQLNNASAVLAALDALKEKLPVSMQAVRRGLSEVELVGRFQFVPGKPQLILDVAHNPHAARSLADNLGNLPECPHTYAVFSMLKDKDRAGVVRALNPHVDTWLVAGLDMPRGGTTQELELLVQSCRVNGAIKAFDSIAEAVQFAYKAAGENDRIVAFGSFYTVAEVMQSRNLFAT